MIKNHYVCSSRSCIPVLIYTLFYLINIAIEKIDNKACHKLLQPTLYVEIHIFILTMFILNPTIWIKIYTITINSFIYIYHFALQFIIIGNNFHILQGSKFLFIVWLIKPIAILISQMHAIFEHWFVTWCYFSQLLYKHNVAHISAML